MDPVTYDHLSVLLREMVRTNNKTQHKQQYALWCNSVRNERDEVNFNSTHFKMQCQSKRENQTKPNQTKTETHTNGVNFKI